LGGSTLICGGVDAFRGRKAFIYRRRRIEERLGRRRYADRPNLKNDNTLQRSKVELKEGPNGHPCAELPHARPTVAACPHGHVDDDA
jgi:hypothetical protein